MGGLSSVILLHNKSEILCFICISRGGGLSSVILLHKKFEMLCFTCILRGRGLSSAILLHMEIQAYCYSRAPRLANVCKYKHILSFKGGWPDTVICGWSRQARNRQ